MNEWRILQGDAMEVLRTLEDEYVHCCVTSPPYWGLRDYGTASWKGGSADCDHLPVKDIHAAAVAASGLGGGKSTQAYTEQSRSSFRDTCGKCGARRVDAQLGLEHTPEEYVEKLVEVFREVRRVLRKDGTVWLNLGDSFAGGCIAAPGTEKQASNRGATAAQGIDKSGHGLKPKDLIGIPWRVAFALQADGWWLRSDIIWSKPNPMPESVTDRPTKAHEYIFLLAKSEQYWYDQDAIREDFADDRMGNPGGGGQYAEAVWGHLGAHAQSGIRAGLWNVDGLQKKRNKRSVWTIATQPYPEAHFATFPPKLIEPCIMAGCPIGGTVLDPFCGTGTALMVALRLNRAAIGIELNPEYIEMAMRRIEPPLFNL